MSECLIYQLKPGKTEVGRLDSEKPAAIRLSGESIGEEHCYFENNDGKVTLYAMSDAVTVRGFDVPRPDSTNRSGSVLERSTNHCWSGMVLFKDDYEPLLTTPTGLQATYGVSYHPR